MSETIEKRTVYQIINSEILELHNKAHNQEYRTKEIRDITLTSVSVICDSLNRIADQVRDAEPPKQVT